MHARRILLIALIAFIALLVILAGGGFYALVRIPKMDAQVNPGSTPLSVSLKAPANPLAWPATSFIPLQITINGSEPVSTVQLFINGTLYTIEPAPTGWNSRSYETQMSWQPGTNGEFILVAKAAGKNGGTGVSNPVKIDAVDPQATFSRIQVASGDTLQGLAATHNVSLGDLAQANPGIDPGTPLEPSTPVVVPNPSQKVTNPHIIPGIFSSNYQHLIGLLNGPQSGSDSSLPIYQLNGQLSQVLPSSSGGGGVTPGPQNVITPAPQNGVTPIAPASGVTPASPSVITPVPGNDQEGSSAGGILKPILGLASFDDLAFYYKKDILKKNDVKLPGIPTIQVNFKGCTAYVSVLNNGLFQDIWDQFEDGFFVYRSRDGGPFERIATLPKIVDLIGYENPASYSDDNQYGTVTYTISAFNSAGESMSDPATVPLDAVGCVDPALQKGGADKPHIENGEVILPVSMDMAYFYISLNGSGSVRVPEGDRMFQPDSGVRFNLNDYLETLTLNIPDADLKVHMEIWGWKGGTLVSAGTLDTMVHRAVLRVCSVEGENGCTGNGGGQWATEANLRTDMKISDQEIEYSWKGTNLSPTEYVCVQYASKPFDPNNFRSTGTIYSECTNAGSKQEGTFFDDLGGVLYTTYKPPAGWGWGVGDPYSYRDVWFANLYPEGTPFTVYVRVQLRQKMGGLERYSNTIVLHYNTSTKPDNKLPPLASPFSSLYEVEIVHDSYRMPNFETTNERWGCVIVDEDPTGTYTPTPTYVCPGARIYENACDDWSLTCLWDLVKGFGESVAELGNYVIFGINAGKDALASGIADVIPGCSDSDTCRNAVSKGVDYGVSALSGMPPNVPSFENIASGTIKDWVLLEVGGIDVPGVGTCDLKCEQKITDQLLPAIKQGKSIQSQQTCVNAYQAYSHNQEPACLDPSIIVHPAWGSGSYPGFIAVKVTRKDTPESRAVTQADADKYKLHFEAQGVNPARAGFYGNYCHYMDNVTVDQLPNPNNPDLGDIANYDYKYFGDGLNGTLYRPADIDIPWLEPGESYTIPIPLYTMSGWWGENCQSGADIQYLLFRGSTQMTAQEYCFSPGSSQEWVPCLNGGKDNWNFDNPESLPAPTDPN